MCTASHTATYLVGDPGGAIDKRYRSVAHMSCVSFINVRNQANCRFPATAYAFSRNQYSLPGLVYLPVWIARCCTILGARNQGLRVFTRMSYLLQKALASAGMSRSARHAITSGESRRLPVSAQAGELTRSSLRKQPRTSPRLLTCLPRWSGPSEHQRVAGPPDRLSDT